MLPTVLALDWLSLGRACKDGSQKRIGFLCISLLLGNTSMQIEHYDTSDV